MDFIYHNSDIVIDLRKMVYDDLNPVYEIEKKCFPDPWIFKFFEDSLKHNECFVLSVINIGNEKNTTKEKIAPQIIGFFLGLETLDEYTILNIAILPEYQGKGLGFQLISKIIESHNLKYDKYFLDVRESNHQAISLYKKIGFKPLYNRKAYYENPTEDSVVMGFEINDKKMILDK
ncbi:MAG: ribosomal protein S18-alanine N-acetyltransferase [Candidatus Cloacimonetes bacterium]|nr:ribosomal protein S18-alanine N-acetyltransferase [Candidatus Cloacimonadota bacterium]